VDDPNADYPWLARPDERFTLALLLDISEVLVRHGYPPLAGSPLAELAVALHRTLHPPTWLG
jgi:hypothetical protein